MPIKHAKFEEGCEAQREAPTVPSENANIAQVVVDRWNTAGLTAFPTRGSYPIALLKATIGTPDNGLSLYLLIFTPYVSGVFTVSPPGATDSMRTNHKIL